MEARQGEERPLTKFYLRRFFRIAPLYYFGILFYLITTVFLHFAQSAILEWPVRYSFLNIMANATFLHSFYVPANNSIVPGGWSIAAEMVFYLAFPFIFPIFRNLRRVNVYYLPIASLAVCWLILQIFRLFLSLGLENNSFLYFSIVNQLPVFLLGIALYFSSRRKLSTPVIMSLGIITFCLAIMSHLIYFHVSVTPFLFGISFIFLFKIFERVPRLSHPLLAAIGKASFSMYVFHFFLTRTLGSLIDKLLHGILTDYLILAISALAVTAVSYFFSLKSMALIEGPGIRAGAKVISRIDMKGQYSVN